MLGDQPVAGVRPIGPVVMGPRLLVATAVEVEEPALELDPGEVPHLLGRDLFLGLGEEAVGRLDVAGLRPEVRDARKDVPALAATEARLRTPFMASSSRPSCKSTSPLRARTAGLSGRSASTLLASFSLWNFSSCWSFKRRSSSVNTP